MKDRLLEHATRRQQDAEHCERVRLIKKILDSQKKGKKDENQTTA